MSGIKALKIGDLVLQRPVIQGGMGVGISLHKLAGAVAASGGMGLISTAQIGFREPDFKTNFVEANLRAIRREMQTLRKIRWGQALLFLLPACKILRSFLLRLQYRLSSLRKQPVHIPEDVPEDLRRIQWHLRRI